MYKYTTKNYAKFIISCQQHLVTKKSAQFLTYFSRLQMPVYFENIMKLVLILWIIGFNQRNVWQSQSNWKNSRLHTCTNTATLHLLLNTRKKIHKRNPTAVKHQCAQRCGGENDTASVVTSMILLVMLQC